MERGWGLQGHPGRVLVGLPKPRGLGSQRAGLGSEVSGASMAFWNNLGSEETGSLWGRREFHELWGA